jgi:hypothetical protein
MAADLEFIQRSTQEALRVEEDCSYNATGHFVAATRWRIVHYLFALPAALLAALVSYLAFTSQGVLAGAIGVVITILTTATLFLRPDHLSSEHKRIGEKYLGLRNKVRLFREIELLHSGRSRHELLQTLGQLSEKKNELNADSLPLPDWAYRRAKQRIQEGSHSYEVDRVEVVTPSVTPNANQRELSKPDQSSSREQKRLTVGDETHGSEKEGTAN